MNFFEELSPDQQKRYMAGDWMMRGYINMAMYVAYEYGQVTFKELSEEATRVYKITKI